MPHYHNFGWYYFAKYILGLAGMILLYTGFLKEDSVVCICPAEKRELDRHKEQNNESSSTGDPTDARARKDLSTQTAIPVVVRNHNAQTPQPIRTKRRKSVGTFRKSLNSKCSTRRILHRGKFACVSSSKRKIEIVGCEKKNLPNHRGCTQRRNNKTNLKCRRSSSSTASQIASNLKLKNKQNNDKSILEEVAGANLRVRNSFAKQENIELEAFVRSIVDQELSMNLPHCRDDISSCPTSTNESISSREIEESEESPNFSSEDENLRYYHPIRCRLHGPTCAKHHPQSPLTSFESIYSHSGTLYFTASSKGKIRPECKIHGRRFRCKIRDDYERKNIHRSRINEEPDESSRQMKGFQSSMNRRKIAERRLTRYKSSMIFTF